MIAVAAIARPDVPTIWPYVAGFVADALPYSRGRFTLASIHDGLMTGAKRLWIVDDGGKPVSAIVTVNTGFPAIKVCTILLCGGERVDSWVADVLAEIELAAVAEGCGQCEIIGRPGWRRKCAGYEHAGDWLVKELATNFHLGMPDTNMKNFSLPTASDGRAA